MPARPSPTLSIEVVGQSNSVTVSTVVTQKNLFSCHSCRRASNIYKVVHKMIFQGPTDI